VLRGAKPLFFNFLPLPLQGRGDTGQRLFEGMGFTGKNWRMRLK